MTSRQLLDDLAAIHFPLLVYSEHEDVRSDVADATEAGVLAAREAFVANLDAAWDGSAPDFDPALSCLEGAIARKKKEDALARLLMAYCRAFTGPRPYTLEALARAADLTPSGVSRSFGADEVAEVAERTGHRRPAAATLKDHSPGDFKPGAVSRSRCTWGGSRANPCTHGVRYTVADKSGTLWACCEQHLPGYLASRPGE